jgi:hypothetical protein
MARGKNYYRSVIEPFFPHSQFIHVQATWLVNPSTLIVDQKWHWQVAVKFNRAIKLNIQAIFRGGLLCSHSFGREILLYSHSSGEKSYFIAIFPGGKLAMGEKWLYNAPIVVFPTSHFYGGKTDYGGKMAL